MIQEFTDANFDEIISSGKPVVIDFWAEWCGPCRAIAPIIDELADEYKERVTIGKLNVDENPTMCEKYGIRTIPTVLFFKDGQLVDKHVAAAAKSVFAAKVDAIL